MIYDSAIVVTTNNSLIADKINRWKLEGMNDFEIAETTSNKFNEIL